MQTKVLEYLRMRQDYGGTDQEIAVFLGMPENTARPRRIELTNSGLVVSAGFTRLTKSRRPATVWMIATEAPKESGPTNPPPF